jgi:hypothetical protein
MVSFSILRLDEISSVTTKRIIYTRWDCWERKRAKSHSALRSFLRRNLRVLENTEFMEAINTVESKDDIRRMVRWARLPLVHSFIGY